MRKKIFIWSQIIILFILKILIIFNTELTEDEAYYFLWSKKLDLSYFDHPPMVAYFIKIGSKIFGENELGVRLPALISAIIFLFIIYLIFINLNKEKSLIAVYIHSLILLFSTGAMVMTPDTPLAIFLILTYFFLLKSQKNDRFIYPAGISYGLSLLSKYTAILIFPSIIFYFLKEKRSIKKFLIFSLLSFIFFLPCLIWNIKNDFVSFKFQLMHGYGSTSIDISNIFIFLRDSILVLSFPLSIFIYYYSFKGLFKEKLNFLTISFFFPFLFFLLTSLKGKIEANWPLVAYIFMVILSIKYLKENKPFYITSSITFLLLLIIHIHAIKPILKIKKDPTFRMKGWKSLAKDVEWFSNLYNIKNYAANNYQIASLLSFYLEGKPYVFSLNINSRENQFTLWQKNMRIPDTLFYVGEIKKDFKKFFKKIEKIGESKTKYRKLDFYMLIKK